MVVPRATSPYGMELLHLRFPPGATAFRKPGVIASDRVVHRPGGTSPRPLSPMIHDLSVEHHSISSLFPDVNHRTLAEYQLHPKQVDFFHEYGYLSGVRILSDEQLEALGQELARLLDASPEERALFYEYNSNESTDPNHVLFHALGAWRIAPGFHDLLWHPAFTVPAAQLLGGSVRFWHDQLLCKRAHHGGLVARHPDYSYWTRTQPLAQPARRSRGGSSRCYMLQPRAPEICGANQPFHR